MLNSVKNNVIGLASVLNKVNSKGKKERIVLLFYCKIKSRSIS